ncbi:MAG: ribonuclease domain-containing protein [Alphaproteobacteria bacterium]
MQTRPLLSRLGAVAVVGVGALVWYLTQGQAAAVDLEQYQQQEASAQVCGHDLGLDGPEVETLVAFGDEQGLRYPYAFAQVTAYLWLIGELPDCYMTKSVASGKGWKNSGTTVDDIDEDGAIGGDTFGNREGLLPNRPRGRYAEADLDYVRGNRGAAARRWASVARARAGRAARRAAQTVPRR